MICRKLVAAAEELICFKGLFITLMAMYAPVGVIRWKKSLGRNACRNT